MYDPHDEKTINLIHRFCDIVFRFNAHYSIYKELYEDQQNTSLCIETAAWFFQDINDIIVEYIQLTMAKILDPAVFKESENLSVFFFYEKLNWSEPEKQRLEPLVEELKSFKSKLQIDRKSQRNKYLAHFDLESIENGMSYLHFSDEDGEKFVSDLKRFCNMILELASGSPYGEMCSASKGDVTALIKALKKAKAFDRILTESNDDEVAHYSSLLEGV